MATEGKEVKYFDAVVLSTSILNDSVYLSPILPDYVYFCEADSSSFWMVVPKLDALTPRNESISKVAIPVKNGDKFYLVHGSTGMYLQAHPTTVYLEQERGVMMVSNGFDAIWQMESDDCGDVIRYDDCTVKLKYSDGSYLGQNFGFCHMMIDEQSGIGMKISNVNLAGKLRETSEELREHQNKSAIQMGVLYDGITNLKMKKDEVLPGLMNQTSNQGPESTIGDSKDLGVTKALFFAVASCFGLFMIILIIICIVGCVYRWKCSKNVTSEKNVAQSDNTLGVIEPVLKAMDKPKLKAINTWKSIAMTKKLDSDEDLFNSASAVDEGTGTGHSTLQMR